MTNTFQNEEKLIYVSPNIPTACPPRAAGPANRGRGFASMFHLSTPGWLSVSFAFDTQLVNRATRPIANGCHKYRFRRNSTQLEMIGNVARDNDVSDCKHQHLRHLHQFQNEIPPSTIEL